MPRDSPVSRGAGYSSRPQRRPAGDRDVYYAQRQKPFRRQSSAERGRPLHQPQLFDYEDFDYDFGPPEPTRKRPESLISNFMNLLRPNKRKSIKPEPSLNEPSLEWLYNDIPDEKDELFFPNNADYDEGNIDLYISPRKFIRYQDNRGRGFSYAENFKTHGMVTFTLAQGSGPKFSILSHAKK